jgi:hypothetical protein
MVFLDVLGLQLSARSGKEAKKTSGDALWAVKHGHCKILFRGG